MVSFQYTTDLTELVRDVQCEVTEADAVVDGRNLPYEDLFADATVRAVSTQLWSGKGAGWTSYVYR